MIKILLIIGVVLCFVGCAYDKYVMVQYYHYEDGIQNGIYCFKGKVYSPVFSIDKGLILYTESIDCKANVKPGFKIEKGYYTVAINIKPTKEWPNYSSYYLTGEGYYTKYFDMNLITIHPNSIRKKDLNQFIEFKK